MKKRVAQWIGGVLLSALVVTIYLFLYNTSIFSGIILNILNTNVLKSYNLVINGDLTGSLLGKSTGIRNLVISSDIENDTLFTANSAVITGWEPNWDMNEIIINNIDLEHYFINTPHLRNIHPRSTRNSSHSSLIVQNVNASRGSLLLEASDTRHTIDMEKLVSNLWIIDGFIGIDVHALSIFAPSLIPDSLIVSGLIGMGKDGERQISDLHIHFPQSDMSLSGEFSDSLIIAQIKGIGINPESLGGFTLPNIYSDLLIDYDIKLTRTTNFLSLMGEGIFELDKTRIPFILTDYTQTSPGQSIDLRLGDDLNNVHLSAKRDDEGFISGMAEVFRLKLDPFIPMEGLHLDEPIGNVSFSGTENKLELSAKLNSFIVNKMQFDSLRSEMTVIAKKEIVFHDGMISQNENRLNFSGEASQQKLNIDATTNISNFSFIQRSRDQRAIQGELSSEFKISGSLRSPHLVGELATNNMGFSDKLRLDGLAKYDFQFTDGMPLGDIAYQGERGVLFGDSLLAYKLLANITANGYSIEDLHMQGSNSIVSFGGKINSRTAEINKLNIIVGDNQFKLVNRIEVNLENDGSYRIPPAVLVFNSAGISVQGYYQPDSGLHFNAAYELLDLGDVTDFFHIRTILDGIATGSAEITGRLNSPEIHADFLLTDGLTLGYPSDSAHVDLILSGNSIYSNRIDASMAGGNLTLIGQLPWGYKMKGDTYKSASQNFSINFVNYRLSDAKFKKVVGLPISGRANGSISIRGTPLKTKLDAQINLTNAKFDTLNFTSVYSDFVYEDNLWTFDSLSVVSNWGYGSGTGFMPVSLDMVADDRSEVSDREIGMNFDFILNQLPFLTSYISSIDAIDGDFIGNLNFSGPLSAPIRNGKVRGHNGRLEISVLGNPITNIHSEMTLIDNTLTIDHFSGRMMFSEGSALNIQGVVGRATSLIGGLIGVDATKAYAGTVSATGEIDLSSFFEPIFDVKLKAKEVYYRSTDGLIEAIADADLQFTGQDTLDVNAVIPVKRAVYYSNFASEESYQQTISQVDSSIFRYSLNTQYASDLLISNDQMEAEFEGELWLLDYGDGIMRFTGTLTAVTGGKFYYLGNELSIVAGEIIFRSVDRDPQITVEAQIEIDGQLVNLVLTGDLTEPELVINAENTQLTQSDVLTYLTINQKLVEVSFDSPQALNPVASYSDMLVEKELSRIGRDLIGLDKLDISGLDIIESGMNLGSDSTTVPRFQLGQRLSKNLIVTYEGALQPTDGKSDYDFGLEYQINRNVSVTSKINQNGEVELNGRLKFSY